MNLPIFGTKAEMLEQVANRAEGISVPPLLYFSVSDWRADEARWLEKIATFFAGERIAVRSSAVAEDGAESSMAGAFLSVLNIDSADRAEIKQAVERVLATYDDNQANQVLIQKMIGDVRLSGVVFSHDLNDGAPYIVADYDDESGRTDRVTGGTGIHKNVRIFRQIDDSNIRSNRVRTILKLVRSLEALLGARPIDIEFAIDADNTIHLLQVRRLSTSGKWNPDVQKYATRRLQHVGSYIDAVTKPLPGLAGETTILANMPDWNPAEIISPKPRPLAASLYRELITRDVWRQARADMGYHRMPPEELMVILAGKPFIDVRVSFNSFLPAGLSADHRAALVDAWLTRLRAYPELHDKVEFDVVHTCRDFSFAETFAAWYPDVLDSGGKTAYEAALSALTARIVDPGPNGSLARAEATLDDISRSIDAIDEPDLDSPAAALARVRQLIAWARVGTLAFSIAARHGFVGEALLRSAVARGALAKGRLEEFKYSIETVLSDLSHDFQNVIAGNSDQATFLKKYGHLRPGTYDILSPRYRDRENLFIGNVRTHEEKAPFELTPKETAALDKLLAEASIDKVDAVGLVDYARRAIRAREALKFKYTRFLSDSLEAIADWGRYWNLGRDEVSYLSIPAILDTYQLPPTRDTGIDLSEKVDRERNEWLQCDAVKLSHFIRDVDDIYVIATQRSAPNFITQGKVEGTVHVIDATQIYHGALGGQIVCIENADPGFDWLFTQGIAALITKFGGANSHMAIRCAEFGVPAAIGCGEEVFSRIVKCGAVVLDCSNHTIRPFDHV